MAFARGSAGFGFWSALALLTKGTGIALALLPPVAILLGRRWEWLRQRFLWQSAALVIALAAPWYLLVPGARHERVAEYGGLRVMHSRHADTAAAMLDFFGPVLCGLAVLGLVLAWRKLREDNYWLAVVSFLPGHFVLRGLVAAWEARHLIILTPEVLLLAMLGFQWLVERWSARWQRAAFGSVLAIAIVAGLAAQWHTRPHLRGPAELALAIPAQARVLVSGASPMEGAVIAELALRDAARPSRIVQRGSKLLATADFLGSRYVSRLSQPGDAEAILEQEQIAFVVIDLDTQQAHTRSLLAYLRSQPDRWVESGRFGERLEMFRAAPRTKDNPL
jgi:4-amino-4-deoxy-L-arabinose transferase-like glycosyltransferase